MSKIKKTKEIHNILKKLSDDPNFFVDLCQVKSDLIKYSIEYDFNDFLILF